MSQGTFRAEKPSVISATRLNRPECSVPHADLQLIGTDCFQEGAINLPIPPLSPSSAYVETVTWKPTGTCVRNCEDLYQECEVELGVVISS